MVSQNRIQSEPSPAYSTSEHDRLLSDDCGTSYNGLPNIVKPPPAQQEEEHKNAPKQVAKGFSVKVLIYWGLICAILGAIIHKQISIDPQDPDVRRRILEKWKHEVECQQRLRDEHKQEADEWKLRANNFEKEWQAKRDKKERERELAGLVWGDFVGDAKCASSGHRHYYARLWNLTPSLPGIESCQSTPATINGITYDTPTSCEDKGIFGVYGHWMADNESICSTFWEFVNRKECTALGSGLRRYEAMFGDFHPGEDAEKLCLSTPLTINGQTFQHPTACSIRGYRGIGPWAEPEYWGIWDIPDDNC